MGEYNTQYCTSRNYKLTIIIDVQRLYCTVITVINIKLDAVTNWIQVLYSPVLL